jgi:hypothetical protein
MIGQIINYVTKYIQCFGNYLKRVTHAHAGPQNKKYTFSAIKIINKYNTMVLGNV